MDLNLDGNAALVLASSGGLGKASATALAREGADVVINGRSEETLGSARAEIEEVATGDVIAHAGDITEPGVAEELVETTVDEFGSLEHLVTSGGGPPRLDFRETTDDDWYNAYDLLVMPVVRSVRAATPHLEADGGGSIVAITSRVIKEASDANVLSSSVRMAVSGVMKVLSEDLGPEVRANTVMPGGHESPRIREIFDAEIEAGTLEDYDEGRARRVENIPVGRLGDTMELGDTVAYLCSDRAGYVSGEAIFIDGGTHASTL